MPAWLGELLDPAAEPASESEPEFEAGLGFAPESAPALEAGAMLESGPVPAFEAGAALEPETGAAFESLPGLPPLGTGTCVGLEPTTPAEVAGQIT